MFKRYVLNKDLLTLSLLSTLIPGTWFTAIRSDIDLYVAKILIITTLFILILSFFLSIILKLLFKENIYNIFSSVLFFVFIFFNFFLIDSFLKSILGYDFLHILTELSITITFIIGSLFFYFSLSKNKIFIRFATVLIPLLLIINLTNTFFSIKNDKNLKYPIFSEDSFLTSKQLKKEKENIYYVSLDGAVPIDFFNKKIFNINVKEFYNTLEANNFKVIEGVESKYFRQIIDLDSITISEIFNLGKIKNAKKFYEIDKVIPFIKSENFFLEKCKIYMCDNEGEKINLTDYNARNLISSNATFPTILKNFNSTPLGILLKKINYDFIWVGSNESNCVFFNHQLCHVDKKSLLSKINNYLDFDEMYNSNYVLRNYLNQTPLLRINKKLNKEGFRVKKNLKKASIQIDSLKRFIDTNNLKKNSFTFIHYGLPKVNFINNDLPVVFNDDCSLINVDKKVNVSKLGNERLQYFNVEGFQDYYSSNYLCMLKRVQEFVEFINLKDPNSQVIIQAGFNVPLFENKTKRNDFKIFTLSKINRRCDENVSNLDSQIDTIKLLIRCSFK